MNVRAVISCGPVVDPSSFGPLPEGIEIYPCVNQLDILSKADAFLTHCGMNSVSESLYMGVPMVLYPQTSEQNAPARRVSEIGAGTYLKEDSPSGIRAALEEVLTHRSYKEAAEACSRDFRSCSGAAGAADFIESAPHSSGSPDPIMEINRKSGPFLAGYWALAAAVLILFSTLVGVRYAWIPGIAAGILFHFYSRLIQNRVYQKTVGAGNKPPRSSRPER